MTERIFCLCRLGWDRIPDRWKQFFANEGISLVTLKGATVVCVRESTKLILCSKCGHFDRAKPILKILLASWTFCTVYKGFRSFNSENFGSVVQRVAKLLAIKLCACTLFGLYGWRFCNRLRPRFKNARGRIILKVWWAVTLQPFDLQTPNFQHWKI